MNRALFDVQAGSATHYVATDGHDAASGGCESPVRTLAEAARRAQPGDVVLVRSGTYREEVVLPRGGTSDAARITYRAEDGGAVIVTGSDPFETWTRVSGDVWQLRIANRYFNGFNPYAERVFGDWFLPQDRVHRRGMVYLDGAWLPEATDLDAVSSGDSASWWSEVDGLDEVVTNAGLPGEEWPCYAASYDVDGFTTITAKLPGVDPNAGSVEVGIRGSVFRPASTGCDYVSIAGFRLINAATNWAAPTMGQSGLVSALWCKGWVIEDNEIAYSRCCGIALGKYADQYDGQRGTTDGYYDTINDALWIGSDGSDAGKWSMENVGSHVVRNNTIHHCGQTGIVGSLGAIASTITGNEIFEVNAQGIWDGAEMAGIKIHAAIDTVISGNHIHHCGDVAGIWLDWMAQGSQVLGNLMHHNTRDLFLEVNHGPNLFANNILLSEVAVWTLTTGQAWAHNLVAGLLDVRADPRETPVFSPHVTWKLDADGKPLDVKTIMVACDPTGAQHWHNNVLVGPADLSAWDGDSVLEPVTMRANVFTAGAVPSNREIDGIDGAASTSAPVLAQDTDGWYLTVPRDEAWRSKQAPVTSASFANAPTPDQPFTNPDGSTVRIDTDYLGVERSPSTPYPGPFEAAGGSERIKVWPLPG